METVISEKNPPPTVKPADAAATPIAVPDDEEAAEAVTVLRQVWPIGQADDFAEQADDCDKTPRGLPAIRACYAKLLALAETQRAKLLAQSLARLACGREIEAAHRKLAEHEVTWLLAELAWLDKNQAGLGRAAAGRTLTAACDLPGDVCDGQPAPGDGYAVVMRVECTKRLFRCGLAGNVCSINKVAAALGLGPDAKPSGVDGELCVRSTGKTLAR
jgi:hypothetical protein